MEIKKYKPQGQFVSALVYGSSGVGKTMFGATAPKPIYASAEGGLLSIASLRPDYVDIKSFADLEKLLKFLKNQDHGYQTVVIDSITEINEIIKAEIKARTGRALESKDWGDLQDKLKTIFRGFRDLPMHTLFLSLDQTEKDEDKVTKVVPSLNGKAAHDIAQYMDIVAYMGVAPDGTRSLITASHGKYLTKDRTRLIGNDTEVNFTVWVDLMNQIEAGEQEIVSTIGKGGRLIKQGGVTDELAEEIRTLWADFWKAGMKAYPEQTAPSGNPMYQAENSKAYFTGKLKKMFKKSHLIELTQEEANTLASSLLDLLDQANMTIAENKQKEQAAKKQPQAKTPAPQEKKVEETE